MARLVWVLRLRWMARLVWVLRLWWTARLGRVLRLPRVTGVAVAVTTKGHASGFLKARSCYTPPDWGVYRRCGAVIAAWMEYSACATFACAC